MPLPLAPAVLPTSFRETSGRKWIADRRSEPAHGSAAADARRAGSSAFAAYMDASRCARPFQCDDRTDEAAGLYPACFAGGSLRALMVSADPRLIFFASSKLGSKFRLGG